MGSYRRERKEKASLGPGPGIFKALDMELAPTQRMDASSSGFISTL